MKIGNLDIADCKIGSTQVNKVYLGANLVWEKASPLLLDLYPDAAAAYSLRKLRTAYAGSAIRVRRSLDNTETDIGFVSNELDTVSLLTFVGAGDGFVTTWYDQSGLGNDAIQATAANQPKIVSLGALIIVNGEASMIFDGINDSLLSSTLSLSQPISYYHIHKVNAIVSNTYYFDSNSSISTQRNVNYYSNTNLLSMFAGSVISNGGIDTNQHLFSMLFNGATSSLYKDSLINITDSNVGVGSLQGLTLGANNSQSSNFMNVNYQEFIVYNNSYTSRTEIESNINNHYSIY